MAKEEVHSEEMTLEEARAYRASLYKPTERILSEGEKAEAFRVFWAENRTKYNGSKDVEPVIWQHLKSIKMDGPDQFEAGIAHFGLKKVK